MAPAYDASGNLLDEDGIVTTDITQVVGYRLPTEAEWEYAAKDGHQYTGSLWPPGYYRYSGSDDIDEVGWYRDNSGDKTQPVGLKKPNELGLYDMTGNVWEWCHDRWESYTSAAKTNPIGPSDGSDRAARGGGWWFGVRNCLVANRSFLSPDGRNFVLGFRLARTVIP